MSSKKKGIIISLGLLFVSCAPVRVCVYIYNFFFFLAGTESHFSWLLFLCGKARQPENGQPSGGFGCQGSRVLLVMLCVLGRLPPWIIEIPCDTSRELYIVTVLSLPSLLFIGEALPKIAFLLALS